MFKFNAGYDGYSMSNRAREAYSNDEMPISKWSKKDILEKIKNVYPNFYKKFSKFTTKQLKDIFLYQSSWHHTSNKFNKTDFYSFNEDLKEFYLKNVEKEIIQREGKIELNYKVIIAYYDYWEGSKKHPKKTIRKDVFIIESNKKTVTGRKYYNSKRLDSLYNIQEIKTYKNYKFAYKRAKKEIENI